MKNKLLLTLALVLLAGPAAAELIQSTTSVQLTFRQCIEAATVCDSLSPIKARKFGGLPGDSQASASLDDPAYGKTSGSAKLTGTPGGARQHAKISSLPGTRNGGNTFIMQRYTNTGVNVQTLTFNGTLTYEQTVPSSNASFPAGSGTRTVVLAELEIFTLIPDAIEAGTSAKDNNVLLALGQPAIGYQSIYNTSTMGQENETGTGSKTLGGSVTIAPGDSVWLAALLQSLGANGAVVEASLSTVTTINEQFE